MADSFLPLEEIMDDNAKVIIDDKEFTRTKGEMEFSTGQGELHSCQYNLSSVKHPIYSHR